MSEKRKEIRSYVNYVGMALAFLLICVHCFMTYKHGVKFINSDQSAELMLGKILAKSHAILAKNWYYSTELRVFSMNLIYSFAWLFAKSYTGVMMLSQVISLILLYFSQVYFYIKIKSKYAWVYPLILMVPFSCQFYIIVIFGLHYIPHIVVTFLTMGMLAKVIEESAKEKISKGILCVYGICLVLSLLEGLGGMRMLIVLYVPLFFGTVFVTLFAEKDYRVVNWKKSTKHLIVFSVVNLLPAAAGYVINNKFLQKRYHFQSWGELNFDSVEVNVLWEALKDYIRLFGFEGGKVFSFKGIACMLAVLTLCSVFYLVIRGVMQWKNWDLTKRMVIVFGIFANACIIAIFLFSDIYYESRYYIPAIVCLWPIVFLVLENGRVEEAGFYRMAKPFICLLIIVTSIALFPSTYKTMIANDETIDERKVTEFLLEEGYEYGFATFWHANVMNQVSEDKLTVCPIEKLDKVNRYKWLTSEEILYPEWDGAVFLVIEDIEHEIYQYNDLLANTDRIVYARDGMWVYSFGSYDEFAAYMSE